MGQIIALASCFVRGWTFGLFGFDGGKPFPVAGKKICRFGVHVEFLSGYQARAAERFAVIEPHFVKDASLGGRPFETLRLPIGSSLR